MAITATEVKFTNIEQKARLEADFTIDEVRDILGGAFPIIDSCTATEIVDEEAGVRTIIFSEKLGTKG